jgi:hypothetical protein
MHHFEITIGETCAKTVVKMDGHVVTGLKSFTVDCGVHDIPRITLELEMAETSLLSGKTQVWVRDNTQSIDAANHRADDAKAKTDKAEVRANVAQARAEAAEAVMPQGSTLAYIIPVEADAVCDARLKKEKP